MISAWLIGDEALITKLNSMPGEINRSILTAVTKLCLDLKSYVQGSKLSGQVLKVRTGNLRRSITPKVEQSGSSTTGIVGTNAPYGAKHEFGFSGTENIRVHGRTIRQVFGRSISPRQINVRAHTRSVNYPERSFLRSALQDMEARITKDLDAALVEVTK